MYKELFGTGSGAPPEEVQDARALVRDRMFDKVKGSDVDERALRVSKRHLLRMHPDDSGPRNVPVSLKKRRITDCLLQATGSAETDSADDSPCELDLQSDRDLTLTCGERLHSNSPLNQSIKNCQSKDIEDKNEDSDDNADSHADDLRRDYQDDEDDTSL
jgi:hypothetical protein